MDLTKEKASSTKFPPTQSLIIESTNGNDSFNILSSSTEGKLCLICGQMSHGFHFGILACRACAAFFRRTVVENKTYFCRQNGQCTIKKEMRNMCRACRFDHCIRLGMNKEDVQMNRDPIGKRNKISLNEETKDSLDIKSPSIDLTWSPKPKNNFISSNITTNFDNEIIKSNNISIIPSLNSEQLLKISNSPIGINASSLTQITLPQTILSIQNGSINNGCFGITTNNNKLENNNSTFALLTCPDLSNSSSVLKRLIDGYKNFQSSQKSLFTVMYPDSIFSEETYRMVKHSEYVKMERGCISLMYSMLTDCFPKFNSLSQELKVSALRIFSNRFTHLDQCFRSISVFPEKGNKRLVLHYGQYIDSNNMEYFFGDEQDPAQTAKSCTKTIKRFMQTVDRMKEMDIRDVEVAALAGIIFWNELAYLDVNDDNIRESIYSGLHNNLILNYGIATTGIRLGLLLDLIHDFNLIEREIRESCIINKFFNPDFAEVWEDA
ncbi:hypothetical protein Mgra_00005369 [Meloidogyne graminicola]|uniref:Nuclear receptor n=1 Tax=Meloidogyne graminicola TaxID=189291 RepID=A0A8S9ZPV7_9BILA|nr:hypothetical protein Mgra_00005369 [Meloidogyne graminicola]